VSERTLHIYATTDRWEMVCGALIDQGVTDPSPAPEASLSFLPRHARHAHHASGSDAAQQDLQSLAGWTPSRRGVLAGITGLLALGAAPMIPAIASAAPAGVSSRMSQLIANFTRLSAELDGLGDDDTDAWDRAADARRPALEELVFERPATIADFAAKMAALVEFMVQEDSELFVLRRLSEDATALAGGAAQ
jgi:hypothetical protein